MRLEDLLEGIYHQVIEESYRDFDVQSISVDSREVTPQSIFVALKGASFNGADFIPKAIEKGARVIVASEGKASGTNSDVCFLLVEDTNKFLRDLATRFYGQPSAQVKTIGITGTNGKQPFRILLKEFSVKLTKLAELWGR